MLHGSGKTKMNEETATRGTSTAGWAGATRGQGAPHRQEERDGAGPPDHSTKMRLASDAFHYIA